MVKYFGLLLFTAAYKKKVTMAHFYLNLMFPLYCFIVKTK